MGKWCGGNCGIGTPWEDGVTPHCGANEPWVDGATPHCGTEAPWEDGVTPHCGTQDPWVDGSVDFCGVQPPWVDGTNPYCGVQSEWGDSFTGGLHVVAVSGTGCNILYNLIGDETTLYPVTDIQVRTVIDGNKVETSWSAWAPVVGQATLANAADFIAIGKSDFCGIEYKGIDACGNVIATKVLPLLDCAACGGGSIVSGLTALAWAANAQYAFDNTDGDTVNWEVVGTVGSGGGIDSGGLLATGVAPKLACFDESLVIKGYTRCCQGELIAIVDHNSRALCPSSEAHSIAGVSKVNNCGDTAQYTLLDARGNSVAATWRIVNIGSGSAGTDGNISTSGLLTTGAGCSGIVVIEGRSTESCCGAEKTISMPDILPLPGACDGRVLQTISQVTAPCGTNTFQGGSSGGLGTVAYYVDDMFNTVNEAGDSFSIDANGLITLNGCSSGWPPWIMYWACDDCGCSSGTIWLEDCSDDCCVTPCNPLPTVTGADTIGPNTTGQYTLNNSQGTVTWAISGSGFSIDQSGLVTTSSACGTANITGTDDCCGEFTKDIRSTEGTWGVEYLICPEIPGCCAGAHVWGFCTIGASRFRGCAANAIENCGGDLCDPDSVNRYACWTYQVDWECVP